MSKNTIILPQELADVPLSRPTSSSASRTADHRFFDDGIYVCTVLDIALKTSKVNTDYFLITLSPQRRLQVPEERELDFARRTINDPVFYPSRKFMEFISNCSGGVINSLTDTRYLSDKLSLLASSSVGQDRIAEIFQEKRVNENGKEYSFLKVLRYIRRETREEDVNQQLLEEIAISHGFSSASELKELLNTQNSSKSKIVDILAKKHAKKIAAKKPKEYVEDEKSRSKRIIELELEELEEEAVNKH